MLSVELSVSTGVTGRVLVKPLSPQAQRGLGLERTDQLLERGRGRGQPTVLRVDFLSPAHGQPDHLGLHIEVLRGLEPPQHLADTPELQGNSNHPLPLRLVEQRAAKGAAYSMQDLRK